MGLQAQNRMWCWRPCGTCLVEDLRVGGHFLKARNIKVDPNNLTKWKRKWRRHLRGCVRGQFASAWVEDEDWTEKEEKMHEQTGHERLCDLRFNERETRKEPR